MKSPIAVLLGLAIASSAMAGAGKPTLLGWNNLGMHCMDDDYQVFSILPPFNTVNAQLIDASGKLVKSSSGYSLSYEAVADPTGSINRSSAGKTNFWDTARFMYGVGLTVPDVGLTGTKMPGAANVPQPIPWDPTPGMNWYQATGIPIVPTDDAGKHNTYPMMRLKARNSAGSVVAQVDVVLPVSDEMDCRACHSSGSGPAAKPTAGWVYDSNSKHDFRYNILRLHDEKWAANPSYVAALQTAGYQPQGLFATAKAGTPILCAECHLSEALPGTGVAGVPSLTQSMHLLHANVLSPSNGLKLDASTNRAACYQCHPGSTTLCLRGAMGAAVDATTGSMAMQCQSCHGRMSVVGAKTRTGWLDEPNCQACHTGTATQNSGQIRYTSVFTTSGAMRVPANALFATNANTPMTGKSLYRFSKGHGGLQCSACHGSTHAEWPASHPNDNIAAQQIQGHSGVLMECQACHASMPQTFAGGPHGMHPVGQAWIDKHHDAASSGGSACQSCHGTNYRGTVLSRAKATRSLTHDSTSFKFWAGQSVGCYDCHNGPSGEGSAPAAPKVSSTLALTVQTGASSVTKAVTLSPTTGVTLRVVSQPAHGSVAVSGSSLVYYRQAGYVGADSFTYAAYNGTRDSNLGTATVTDK
jgi:hypothetical protein